MRSQCFLLFILRVTGEKLHVTRFSASSDPQAFLLSFSRGMNLGMQSHPFIRGVYAIMMDKRIVSLGG